MFCPSCGAQASEGLRFCRACGMALEPVTRLIADLRLGIGSAQPEAPAKEFPLTWEKRVERAGKGMTGASLLAFCLLLVSLVPLGMAHLKATDSIVLWTVEILAIVLLGGVGLLNLPRIVRGIQSKRPPQPASIRRAEPTNQLGGAPNQESSPSVTEATTRSLERIDHN
jgi:hypothetical protein